jgi:hypothetical protein
MLNSGPDYTPQNPAKVILPSRVPSHGKMVIYSDDPRNNRSYLSKLTVPYIIIPASERQNFSDTGEQNVDDVITEDLASEYVDPDTLTLDPPPDTGNGDGQGDAPDSGLLSPPVNLVVTSFRLEDNSAEADGTVSWTASLEFDDVSSAIDYDYSISLVES